MATYYVRKSGLDTNGGLSAGDAFLTIDKAANTVAAGDTVYVGAGTYRETVTMDTAGSSGSVIKYIADVDGSQTGDAGLVVISAFTDSNTVVRSSCWDPNDGKAFIEVYDFVMQGGTTAVVEDFSIANNNYEGCVFDGCVFVAGPDRSDRAFLLDFNAPTSPTSAGLTIRNCFWTDTIELEWNGNETADVDLKITVENCVAISASTTNVASFWFDLVTAGTYGCGGVSINNCTMVGYTGVSVDEGTSTTYPVDVRNCYLLAQGNPLYKFTSNDGALTSDYNTYTGSLTNVTAGANDRDDTSAVMLGGIADLPLLRKWGWSPYLPWEPMQPIGGDDWTSLIADGASADAPATDFYGNPRPAGPTNVDDRGAVEARARLTPETTTVRTGTTAGKFTGTGRHSLTIPVNAASTTVSVYCRKDATYTGTAPQLKVSRIPGVADQTDTGVAAADTWEELTVTFTPTSAGVAVVELISNDTSATGECFFDDLTVT